MHPPFVNAYYLCILVLGGSMQTLIAYSFFHMPKNSISENMLADPVYRIFVSSTVMLQLATWSLCLHSKWKVWPDLVFWGYLAMILMICSWVGLTAILRGDVHITFLYVFTSSFLVLLLILYTLSHQPQAVLLLRGSILVLILCALSLAISWGAINDWFYLVEHIAFLIYSTIFVCFFMVHPFYEWGEVAGERWLQLT
jgi:hypothetical protein